MAIPLVALGLSSDASFIKMVCRSIRPDRFTETGAEGGFLTLKDFIMVFDKDNYADSLLSALLKVVKD
jgi:hypothetical protein